MGSTSDWDVMKQACETLEELEIYDRLEEVRKMILELNESVE